MKRPALLALFLGLVCVLAGAAFADAATETDLAQAVAAAQAKGSDSPAFKTNFPVARLCLKKLRLLDAAGGAGAPGAAVSTSGLPYSPGELRQALVEEGMAHLQAIAEGKVYRAQPGRLSELAYVAADDGTVQPYYLYLPPNYTPARHWPLIVFLHGYVPSISVLAPWLPEPKDCAVAGRLGCMLLVPYGRRNTDFEGVGEVDVLKTLALVRRDYPVDSSRIYMSGVSMGGRGAWDMALWHPGIFAAATPMCGQTDMLRWWGWPVDKVPPFKKWLIEWGNPIDLVMNARSGHFFAQQGALDQLVPVEQSHRMIAAAKALGIPMEYYEHPGVGHYIYWSTDCYKRAWTWQMKYKLDPAPREIDYKVYSLDDNRAWWLRVDQIAQWGRPGEVKIRVDEARRRVRLTAENVAALSLDPKQGKLAADAVVEINGKARKPEASAKGWWRFDLSPIAGAASGFPPVKRAGLCGPVEAAFNTPFMVVRGTGPAAAGASAEGAVGEGATGQAGGDDLTALLHKVEPADPALVWATEWDGFADGRPRMIRDSDVTARQVENYNLLLFGTPQTNSVLGRIAGRLPIKFLADGYKVGEHVFRGAGLGLIFCYPNPEAPDRYVVVYSGARYGAKLSINHKHDLLPDFLVYKGDSFDYDDTNRWVCGGFFDSAWRLSKATTWVR